MLCAKQRRLVPVVKLLIIKSLYMQPLMSCQLASCSNGQLKRFSGISNTGNPHMGCLIRLHWRVVMQKIQATSHFRTSSGVCLVHVSGCLMHTRVMKAAECSMLLSVQCCFLCNSRRMHDADVMVGVVPRGCTQCSMPNLTQGYCHTPAKAEQATTIHTAIHMMHY